MNKKLPFLCFLLLFISTVYSQNISLLYEDYVPKQADLQQVGINLEINAKIHPELIYYYISFLNSVYNEKISHPDSNYLNKFRSIRSNHIEKRNSWANRYIEKIDERYSLRLKRNRMQNYYEEVLAEIRSIKDSTDLPIDENKIEFFEYRYFYRDKSEQYNSKKDYAALNKKFFQKLNQELVRDAERLSELDENQQEQIIERYIDYWYAIDNPELLYDLVQRTHRDNFHESTNFYVSLNVVPGFGKAEISDRHSFVDKPLPTFDKPIRYSFDQALHYFPVAGAEVGIKIALKDEVDVFSNLNIGFNYVYMISDEKVEDKGKEFYTFTYNIPSGSERDYYSYVVGGIQNLQNHLISMNITTPIFHFSKAFYLDFGLNVNYHLLEYDVIIEKNSVRDNKIEKKQIGQKLFPTKVDESVFSVFPTLSIRLALSESIQMNFQSMLTSKIFGLKSGFVFYF